MVSPNQLDFIKKISRVSKEEGGVKGREGSPVGSWGKGTAGAQSGIRPKHRKGSKVEGKFF